MNCTYLTATLSFICEVWLYVTVQCRWRTIQTGHWDSVKGRKVFSEHYWKVSFIFKCKRTDGKLEIK